MARRKMQHGECALCGAIGDSSFEHVPPQKAFNNLRTVGLSWDEGLRLGPDTVVKGKVLQGGVGGYTLCPGCNNNTGTWYARALVEWFYRGMEILERSHGRAELFHMRGVHPLRVLKEIMVMFCSVNRKITTAQPWLMSAATNLVCVDRARGPMTVLALGARELVRRDCVRKVTGSLRLSSPLEVDVACRLRCRMGHVAHERHEEKAAAVRFRLTGSDEASSSRARWRS